MQFTAFIFLLVIWPVSSDEVKSPQLLCSSLSACGSCIALPQCAWCRSSHLLKGASRCDSVDNLIANACPPQEVVNPVSSIDATQNKHSASPIQLHPKKVRVKMRKNDTQRFTVTYAQALDYPIDLYYLMDMTYSMKDHKDMVAQLADNLAASMFNVTPNFRLGFGSFIDKVVLPYANMVPARLDNPCIDAIECAPPYGFRNHLALNSNITKFTEEVSATPLSGNLDNAEGGFDAIMQVLVCKDAIQWNDVSRKIILFATDSIFHYAGDGKLGGIIKPNDGLCHLSSDGYYSESIYQDYPSLSQINRVVTDSKANIIFAVPEHSLDVYLELSKHIPGSVTGKLESDSSNIVDIIRDNFKKIASRVELFDNSSSVVNVRYMTSCLGKYKRETNACEGVGIGTSVNFDVEVTVNRCPPNGKETFVISPVGLVEYTTIELEVMCKCDCEEEDQLMVNSTECSGNGTFACGVCQCDQNRFGRRCECDGDDAMRQDMMDQCKRNDSSAICSNRGDCVCGECLCHPAKLVGIEEPSLNELITGKFCECDTFSCPRDINGQSCGGIERGICCDGECRCMNGWSGADCLCSTRNDSCFNVDSSDRASAVRMCSGRGRCECGKCQCNVGYYGEFCQDCATCEGQCSVLQPCVECRVYSSGIYSLVECKDKCNFRYDIVDDLKPLPKDRQCIFIDIEGCSITFNYNYDDLNQVFVRVLKGRQCPLQVNLVLTIGSIAGVVFLIGLVILIIYRLFTWYKDKLEYQKFEQEISKTSFGNEINPIYKSALTHHPNPMFNPTS